MSSPALVVFTIPKAFDGVTGIQQRNAIQSWLKLGHEIEVVLLGDDPGTALAAQQLGVRHIPNVERNEYGTPLVSSVFALGTASTTAPVCCYVNADIILTSDFPRAVQRAGVTPFLLCGQRSDLDLNVELDFTTPRWESDLRDRATTQGKLHGVTGIDYFVFTRQAFHRVPPFAVGRTMWDNWLIFNARAQGVRVIDATAVVTAIHQNHDYAHISGGIAAAWEGPEAIRNHGLASDMLYPFTIADATWQLTRAGLSRRVEPARIMRLMEGWAAVRLRHHSTIRRLIRRAARAAR